VVEGIVKSGLFRQRLTPTQIVSVFEFLRHEASLVTVTIDVQGRATHPEGDIMHATALSGKSDYLVTGDLQLQQLDQFERVKIRSSPAFLDDLRSTPPTKPRYPSLQQFPEFRPRTTHVCREGLVPSHVRSRCGKPGGHQALPYDTAGSAGRCFCNPI
jgi:hypothetical protein